MTCPVPETLVPHALGTADPRIARHAERCAPCRAEIDRLRAAVGVLRSPASLDRRTETPHCLDELTVADFVDGRLTPEGRGPVVDHLLTCARCRSVVRAAGRLLADPALAREVHGPRPGRWWLPIGAAAAAALLLLILPRGGDNRISTREPPLSSIVAPVPKTPLATVARVDRFTWSSVPHAEQYRLRLYDAEGSVLWRVETADTSVGLPGSVALSAGVTYFWRVEAQTERRRGVASDLVQFQLVGLRR